CLLNPVLQTLDSGALLPETHCSERHGYSITSSPPAIRLTDITEHLSEGALLWLDVGRPDHPGPFLGFVGDVPTEVGGRAREHLPTQFRETCLQCRLRKAGVDLLVETIDDRGGRIARSCHAIPRACFVARHELADRWHIRQRLKTDRTGHPKGPELTASHVFDPCRCGNEHDLYLSCDRIRDRTAAAAIRHVH